MQKPRQQKRKQHLLLLLILVLLLLLILPALALGSSDLGLREIATALLHGGDAGVQQIVLGIRLPRVLAALMAGAALSISGAVIQTVIRNPLGSPYTLGLSAASMFGAALAIVMLGHWARQAQLGMLANNPWLISASAFLFGLLCALFITGIARWRGASPETLIMAGIIISALFGSATSLLQYLSDDVELAAIVSWMFGDLGKATPQNVRIMALALLPALLWFLANTFPLSTLHAGDEVAASLGVRVNRLRMLSVVVASLITAVTVAFFGVIAFVGLIIPHITRRLLGFGEGVVLTGSALLGALFLLASDLLARTLVAPVVLPVGIITSFVGAPFFLYLLFHRLPKRP